MKKFQYPFLFAIAFLFLLVACSSAIDPVFETIVETVVVESKDEMGEVVVTQVVSVPESEASNEENIAFTDRQDSVAASSDRLIIKDAVMTLLVDNTDIAIERLTQTIGDMNGYTISTQIWYETFLDEPYKFATFTIGVPVDQFEPTLQRLRNLSVRVLDESASGVDVTDQFVDLQSRLDNLKATRDRIREFLEVATTVEEALLVNEQLSEVEAQIEEIQGRINYLADRAAYSTITITFEPVLPDIPTPTPSPTPTATPTPTPIPWTASETFQDATRTVSNAYKGILNAAIWIIVVVIPIVLPPAVILWLIFRFASNRYKTKKGQSILPSEK